MISERLVAIVVVVAAGGDRQILTLVVFIPLSLDFSVSI